jgi:hypothetical protein
MTQTIWLNASTDKLVWHHLVQHQRLDKTYFMYIPHYSSKLQPLRVRVIVILITDEANLFLWHKLVIFAEQRAQKSTNTLLRCSEHACSRFCAILATYIQTCTNKFSICVCDVDDNVRRLIIQAIHLHLNCVILLQTMR